MSVLLLMLFGMAVSNISALILSQPAYAAGESALLTEDINNQVLRFIAGRTLQRCATSSSSNNLRSQFQMTDITAGKTMITWPSGGTANVGYVLEPKDGMVGCTDDADAAVFMKLLGAFGYSTSNYEPLLLSLGYEKATSFNGYELKNGSRQKTQSVFSYTEYDQLPGSVKYAMAYKEFLSGGACASAQNTSGNITLKVVVQSSGADSASTVDVKYSYGITDRRNYPSGTSITCSDIAKRANDNASAYAAYLTEQIASEKRSTLINGPIGDYCSERYPSGVSSIVVQSCLDDTYKAYQACWAKVVESSGPIGSEDITREPTTSEKVKCMQSALGGEKSAIQTLVAAIDSTNIEDLENDNRVGANEETCTASGKVWDEATGSCVDNGAACTMGTLGWILCPIATMVQGLIQMIATVIGNIMEIDPIGGSTELQNVWRIFVGFANLLLVIAFMIVIFSQATSVGLSAYGIKKMLPRIIAAAILINLSYFICTIAIDISNIVGGSVAGIVNSVPIDVETSTTQFNTGATWASNVTALALTGVTAWLAVAGWAAFAVPVLITGGLAIVSLFLMIALRQALVLLLVIVAPLAFAAMILPNTEQLFTKWRKLFVNMLIMYPVVMFFMYGSKLVGQIIQVATSTQGDDTSAMMTQMVVFVILTIAPFAGLFMYLKNSNKLMSMATGAIDKLGSGARSWGDDWAKRKKSTNRFEQDRQAKINATNEARQRANLVRMGKRDRAPRGLSADAQRLWQTNIDEANSKLNDREIAGHGSYLTRPASEFLLQGHRIDQSGNIVDASGAVVKRAADVDQKTQNAMRYAQRYNLLDTDNGRKAIMSNLYKFGGMDSERLKTLVEGNATAGVTAARDAASLTAYSNDLAAQNGMDHLKFNTTDSSGKIEWGGALPVHPSSTSKAANTRAATDKLAAKGVGAISKDIWSDTAVQPDLVESVLSYKAANPDAYERSLSKADGEQIQKMQDALRAQRKTAEAAALVGEYNAAVLKYK